MAYCFLASPSLSPTRWLECWWVFCFPTPGFFSRVGILWATFWGFHYAPTSGYTKGFTVCAARLLTICHEKPLPLLFRPRN